MTNEEKFDMLLRMYKNTEFTNKEKGAGVFIPRSKKDIAEFQEILSDQRQYGIALRDDYITASEIHEQQKIEITLTDPRIGLGLLASDIQEVIKSNPAQYKRFYLISDNYSYNEENAPDSVKKYKAVLSLIDALEECAAYLDKENNELIFFNGKKISIPIIYTYEDIKNISIDEIKNISIFVNNDLHKDQKLEILSNSISNLCRNHTPCERFLSIIRNLSSIYNELTEGYKLFASNFSYEKIKESIESEKIEEISKIHKTFSEIQNQIIAVPIATIIGAIQMKETADIDSVFWVNTTTIIAIWVSLFFIYLSIRNQGQTLKTIEQEIIRKKYSIRRKHSTAYETLSIHFSEIEKRLSSQKNNFLSIKAIIYLCAAFPLIPYTLMTKPVAAEITLIKNNIINYLLALIC